jgi:hypothetical protein
MNAALRVEEQREPWPPDSPELPELVTSLAVRLRGEYREMPGLRLTVRQAARLFGIEVDLAAAVLAHLRNTRVLALAPDGAYSLLSEPSRWTASMSLSASTPDLGATRAATIGTMVDGSLSDASLERLASLHRHWTWADEAMSRFDRELAKGWDYDYGMPIHPFGAYAHWCALLCAFAEGALERSLLPQPQLEPIRPDLEASVPMLKRCRQLLTVIPASLDEHPRVVDLIYDDTLPRLRRIHRAFGEALRREQDARRAGR